MPGTWPCHTPNVRSVSATRRSARPPSGPSTRHTSTASALVEATANRTPPSSTWAPRGKTGTIGQDRGVGAPDARPHPAHPVIRMVGVGVRRGRSVLLADIDWAVELDERWVVLGPNGA